MLALRVSGAPPSPRRARAPLRLAQQARAEARSGCTTARAPRARRTAGRRAEQARRAAALARRRARAVCAGVRHRPRHAHVPRAAGPGRAGRAPVHAQPGGVRAGHPGEPGPGQQGAGAAAAPARALLLHVEGRLAREGWRPVASPANEAWADLQTMRRWVAVRVAVMWGSRGGQSCGEHAHLQGRGQRGPRP